MTADRWKSAVGAVERLMHDPYGSSGEMTASVTNRVEIALIKISLGCTKLIRYVQKVWNATLLKADDINGSLTLASRNVIFWTFGAYIIGLVHPRYIVIKKFFRGGLLVLDGFPPLRELFHLQQFFPMLDIELSSFLQLWRIYFFGHQNLPFGKCCAVKMTFSRPKRDIVLNRIENEKRKPL